MESWILKCLTFFFCFMYKQYFLKKWTFRHNSLIVWKLKMWRVDFFIFDNNLLESIIIFFFAFTFCLFMLFFIHVVFFSPKSNLFIRYSTKKLKSYVFVIFMYIVDFAKYCNAYFISENFISDTYTKMTF